MVPFPSQSYKEVRSIQQIQRRMGDRSCVTASCGFSYWPAEADPNGPPLSACVQ